MISKTAQHLRAFGLASLALLLVMVPGCATVEEGGIGSLAPDFEVESLQSSSIKTDLKSFRGKVVILDYWATWCGPCKQISPQLEKWAKKYKDRGLVVLPISNEDRKVQQNFELKSPHGYPVYVDPFDLARSAYKVNALPTLVVIDREGKIAFYSAGFGEGTMAEMEQVIVKALG